MPIPIPAGFNIYIKHNLYPHAGDMNGMSASSDHYSIGFVISGDRKSITTSTISEYHTGQIGMMSPGILHRTISMSDVPYERILIKYRPAMAEPFIQLVGRPVFDRLYQQHIHSFPEAAQQKILTIMTEMNDEFSHYGPFSEYILQGMLTHLLIMIMTERIPEDHVNIHFPYENEQIMQASYYIEQNYNRALPIKEVAESVNLSPSYFSALFKKMMGTTYSQYVNNIRLQRALLLLNNSQSDSITEIAAKCGFANANYFCDVFKKAYTYSPTSYRKFYQEKCNR